jgi:seryl-tRNA synthetase
MTVTSAQYRDLEVKRGELRRRYDALTKRIAALDTDIGREMDAERRLVLQERRVDLATERDQVTADMERIEQQLTGIGAVATGVTPPAPAQIAPAVSLSAEEHASLVRQLTALRENLRLIEERKTEYVQSTDIPLQLVREEHRIRQQIAELEDQLNRME